MNSGEVRIEVHRSVSTAWRSIAGEGGDRAKAKSGWEQDCTPGGNPKPSQPESSFSAPVPWNCIAPEADRAAKRTLAPKRPAFAEEKPHDSLPSLPRPPHREPSKLIAPTPIHPPLPSVIRIRGVAVGRLVCLKRQQRDPVQHRREPYSRQVSFRQHQPVIPR